jgi:hypothetical protein
VVWWTVCQLSHPSVVFYINVLYFST